MKRFLMIAASLSLLGACAPGNFKSDFDCAAQIGSPCSTIEQADQGNRNLAHPVTEKVEDTLQSTLTQAPLQLGKGLNGGMPDGGFAYQTERYRVPEIVGKVWIAPYLDENNLLHESYFVHFVIQEPKWVNR